MIYHYRCFIWQVICGRWQFIYRLASTYIIDAYLFDIWIVRWSNRLSHTTRILHCATQKQKRTMRKKTRGSDINFLVSVINNLFCKISQKYRFRVSLCDIYTFFVYQSFFIHDIHVFFQRTIHTYTEFIFFHPLHVHC